AYLAGDHSSTGACLHLMSHCIVFGRVVVVVVFFFFQAEDGIRDGHVTGVQTCALPIFIEARLTAQGAGMPDSVPVTLSEVRDGRSEERRVGKECRSRWSAYY